MLMTMSLYVYVMFISFCGILRKVTVIKASRSQQLEIVDEIQRNVMETDKAEVKDNSSDDEPEWLSAAKFITKKAQDVRIRKEGIKQLALHIMVWCTDTLKYEKISDMSESITNKFVRKYEFYPFKEDPRISDWLFVLHTLNFSLWYPKDKKQWTVNGNHGFLGLCNAMKRLIDKNVPIWVPQCYSNITETEFEYMFQGDDKKVTIPLVHERVKILHEVGKILLKNYKGTFTECIRSSENDGDKLVKLLFNEFESYRDEVEYEGLKVRFCIKARALVNDIWTYHKTYEPKFKLDTKNLMSSIFVNYRAPELLYHYDILRYSDKLMDRFTNNTEPLEYGSREEIELRGCSLLAVKLICQEVNDISKYYNREAIRILLTEHFKVPILVDNYLFISLIEIFDKGFEEQKPFHYIKTVHY
ncbi:queuosine salvage protein-like isoform X2 [Cataglyphis hispanica]|uniref:queuosine salvage protein-like isoform X2 n=1 Tax=Cataglyphis hispanica TaxID=1086592 RepID=UPI00217FFA57|nr:queuosine salvage protein-like isoform X2 [Cataglyphis hispanica]